MATATQNETYPGGVLQNALIDQKQELWESARKLDLDYLEDAIQKLQFVAELWRTLDYGYKVGETAARIKLSAEVLLDDLSPRATRQRARAEALIAHARRLTY